MVAFNSRIKNCHFQLQALLLVLQTRTMKTRLTWFLLKLKVFKTQTLKEPIALHSQVLSKTDDIEQLVTSRLCRQFWNHTFSLPSRSFYLNSVGMRASDVVFKRLNVTSGELEVKTVDHLQTKTDEIAPLRYRKHGGTWRQHNNWSVFQSYLLNGGEADHRVIHHCAVSVMTFVTFMVSVNYEVLSITVSLPPTIVVRNANPRFSYR